MTAKHVWLTRCRTGTINWQVYIAPPLDILASQDDSLSREAARISIICHCMREL